MSDVNERIGNSENRKFHLKIYFQNSRLNCDSGAELKLTFMLEYFKLYAVQEIFDANIDRVCHSVCYSVS